MSSININLPSGYINAGLILILEILLINVVLVSTRKRMESCYTYRSLKKGKNVPLRQINILGFEARRDMFSVTLAVMMIGIIIGVGVMEWGVNGETHFTTVMQKGFLFGGDLTMGFSSTHSVLETRGYIFRRPTGEHLKIVRKCSATTFHNGTEDSLRVGFSMRRAAVSKSKVEQRTGTTVLYLKNSSITCFGENISVRPGSRILSGLSTSESSWNMDPSLWEKRSALYLWGTIYHFEMRKNISLDVDPYFQRLGYAKRYQLRIRNGINYIIWDIYKSARTSKHKYMLIGTTWIFVENNGTYISNFQGKALDQFVEVISPIQLGHLIVVACLSSSRDDSQSLHLELADIFYSNLGSFLGYAVMFRQAPLTPIKMLGEYGAKMNFKFESFPFQVPIQVTRIEKWSLVSFVVLMSFLIIARIVCEVLWKRLPIKPNPMSVEWLGNEVIRSRSFKDGVTLEKPRPCLAMYEIAGEATIAIVHERKLQSTEGYGV